MKELKEVSTKDLIAELETRQEIKKISVGPYRQYRLSEKYTNNRNEIKSETVLVVEEELKSQELKNEWRRFSPLVQDTSEVEQLCSEKNITKEDLLLILRSISAKEEKEKQIKILGPNIGEIGGGYISIEGLESYNTLIDLHIKPEHIKSIQLEINDSCSQERTPENQGQMKILHIFTK